MGAWKARKPVKRDLCWICDRRLYAGGRSWAEVEIHGVMRPVHVTCKRLREKMASDGV